MMMAHSLPRLAPFGHPDSIQPVRLFSLPPVMQAEGLRLLFEMGETMERVRARTGLSASAIGQIINGQNRPFVRGDDAGAAGAVGEV